MKRFLFLVWLPFASHDLEAQSNSFDANAWVANGTVNAMVASGSNLYLGGSFSHVGPLLPYGVALSGSTGLPNMSFVKPNDVVRVVIPDGSGGWYIGGDFTTVGGVARLRLARINSDGSLNSWNQGTSGSVYSLALDGGILYVGGSFTSAGGITRNRLAAFDVSTGALTSWNPNVTKTSGTPFVYTIAVSGSTVFIGGLFTHVTGTARNNIAALDATATASPYLTSWNPNAGNTVYALALSGGNLYVGGSFTSFGSSPTTTRNRIAAFAVSTGSLTAWDPSATGGYVNAIAVNGSTVYAAGTFTTIGGSSRNRLAALEANATGASGSPYLLP